MSTATATVVLALLASVQVIALAWIAAWQARAARLVKELNGKVAESIERATAVVEERLPPV